MGPSSSPSRRRKPLFAGASLKTAGLPLGCRPKRPGRTRSGMRRRIPHLDAGEPKTARDVGWRIEGFILPALGDVACAKLTAERLRAWHSELAKQPPRVRTAAGQEQRYRALGAAWDAEQTRRRRGSANRTLTTLKAALNRAWRDGKILSDSAWRMVAPFRQTGAARARMLTVEECRRLINASAPDFRRLVQAALATGARFGELAAFDVGDFDANSGPYMCGTAKADAAGISF